MSHPPQPIPVTGTLGGATTVLNDGRVVTFFADIDRMQDIHTAPRPARPVYQRTSQDGGRTWSEPRVAFAYAAGPGSASPVVALHDRRGRLHVFGNRYFHLNRAQDGWHSVVVHTASDDDGQTWTETKPVDFGHTYTGSLNSVIQMDNGRILLPLSYLATDRADGKFVSMTVWSDDGGATWGQSNDCAVGGGGQFLESGAAEPIVIQFPGGMVWMLIRTVTGYFWESFSNDGAVWTPPQITRIVSSNAPGGLARLPDGRIVLAWNNLYGEPMHEGHISYARQRLFAAISADEAQTWSAPKVIARQHPGDPPNTHIAYPFLWPLRDGSVLVLYHRVGAVEGRNWYDPIRELVRLDPDWLAEA